MQTFLTIIIELGNLSLEPTVFPYVAIGVVAALFSVGLLYYVIRETRKIRYKFLTVGSHKLRTPLSKIGAAVAEVLEKKEGADARKELFVLGEYEERMLRQVAIEQKRLVGMVNLLLEVAESETGYVKYDRAEFDLIKLIQGILDGYQKSKWRNDRAFIEFESTKQEVVVEADRKRIGLVLQVLFENAITYSPAGGRILVQVVVRRNSVTVSVQDPGMGITRKEQRNIFKKFYRSDRALKIDTEGTGVALFLAKHIIRGHHGKMWFTSQGENRGSTFHFSLPL